MCGRTHGAHAAAPPLVLHGPPLPRTWACDSGSRACAAHALGSVPAFVAGRLLGLYCGQLGSSFSGCSPSLGLFGLILGPPQRRGCPCRSRWCFLVQPFLGDGLWFAAFSAGQPLWQARGQGCALGVWVGADAARMGRLPFLGWSVERAFWCCWCCSVWTFPVSEQLSFAGLGVVAWRFLRCVVLQRVFGFFLRWPPRTFIGLCCGSGFWPFWALVLRFSRL